MYRSCIFCSADLGSNESVEQFPVGRSLSFDAARGRLWAVCPKCARWNLAPLEERWEALEACERLFRDARVRSQSENIGLAKLRDRTRLIRIGQAPGREVASWRYGRSIVRRHQAIEARNRLLDRVASGVGVSLLFGPVTAVAVTFPLFGAWGVGWAAEHRRLNRVVHVVRDDPVDPTQRIIIRREDLDGSRLSEPDDGLGTRLFLPYSRVMRRGGPTGDDWGRFYVNLRGAEAESVLRRIVVHLNDRGVPERSLADSLELMQQSGSAGALMRTLTVTNRTLPEGGPVILALEMALHEETERRAMEGELAVLEAMWREAEEIAAIADRLPDTDADPPRFGASRARAKWEGSRRSG